MIMSPISLLKPDIHVYLQWSKFGRGKFDYRSLLLGLQLTANRSVSGTLLNRTQTIIDPVSTVWLPSWSRAPLSLLACCICIPFLACFDDRLGSRGQMKAPSKVPVMSLFGGTSRPVLWALLGTGRLFCSQCFESRSKAAAESYEPPI